MVDGHHKSFAVAEDARISLRLLRQGGWLLFDDVENMRKKKDHVKQGIELFLSKHSCRVKLLWKHHFMEAYQKL